MENKPETAPEKNQIAATATEATDYLFNLERRLAGLSGGGKAPLEPEETAYINQAAPAAAHLINYLMERSEMKIPPESLPPLLSSVRDAGFKLVESPAAITADGALVSRQLSLLATRREWLNHYTPNKELVVSCAKQLCQTLAEMAAKDQHQQPQDYSVDISLQAIKPPEQIRASQKLLALLEGLEPDSSGLIRLEDFHSNQLESILRGCGVAVGPPPVEEIRKGIEAAKEKVKNNQASEYLESLPFMPRELLPDTSSRPKVLIVNRPVYINPDSIAGADRFPHGWTGEGSPLKNADDGTKKSSLEVIQDYATRETKLPDSEIDLTLLADGSVIAYAPNSHRAAAAKLRHEPLPVRSLYIYY